MFFLLYSLSHSDDVLFRDCSSQFSDDIRSQLENDFVHSLRDEVCYFLRFLFPFFFLVLVFIILLWIVPCRLVKGVRLRLFGRCCGTLGILLGIQIFLGCSLGRIKRSRGEWNF